MTTGQPSVAAADGPVSHIASELEAVFDVPVQVSAVLGRARMEINDLLKIGPGATVKPVPATTSQATTTRSEDP